MIQSLLFNPGCLTYYTRILWERLWHFVMLYMVFVCVWWWCMGGSNDCRQLHLHCMKKGCRFNILLLRLLCCWIAMTTPSTSFSGEFHLNLGMCIIGPVAFFVLVCRPWRQWISLGGSAPCRRSHVASDAVGIGKLCIRSKDGNV